MTAPEIDTNLDPRFIFLFGGQAHLLEPPFRQRNDRCEAPPSAGATTAMTLRAPTATMDLEVTSKYQGVFELPDMAGTAPPVVYGKLSDSEFSLVATPMVAAGNPVSWQIQERKEAGHVSLSVWRRDSKLNDTILYGNGIAPLRR